MPRTTVALLLEEAEHSGVQFCEWMMGQPTNQPTNLFQFTWSGQTMKTSS